MDTNGMSEDMLKLFQMMKMEMEKQTNLITQSITDTLMRTIDDKIQPIIEENKYLKIEVETMNRKIKYLEDANRKNNIILHGVEETENNHEELFNIIKTVWQETNINLEKSELNKYHRLGRKQDGRKNRPILISFMSNQKKVEVLKNKTKMPQHTYLTEDFSKETLEMRKNLQQQLKQEKEKGNNAYIKNNKLIVKGKPDVEKRRRESSLSPKDIQTPSQATEGRNIAPSKMHKTDAFAYMRARSFTLSEKQNHKA